MILIATLWITSVVVLIVPYLSIVSHISVIIAFWSNVKIIFIVALKQSIWLTIAIYVLKIDNIHLCEDFFTLSSICFRHKWNYLLCTRVQSAVNFIVFYIYFSPRFVSTDFSSLKKQFLKNKMKKCWGGISTHSLIEHLFT